MTGQETALVFLLLGVVVVVSVRTGAPAFWTKKQSKKNAGVKGAATGLLGDAGSATEFLKKHPGLLIILTILFIFLMMYILFREWTEAFLNKNGWSIPVLILATAAVLGTIATSLPKGTVRSGLLWGISSLLLFGCIWNMPEWSASSTTGNKSAVAPLQQQIRQRYTTPQCPGILQPLLTLNTTQWAEINPGNNCDVVHNLLSGTVEFDGPLGRGELTTSGGIITKPAIRFRAKVNTAQMYYSLCPTGSMREGRVNWDCSPMQPRLTASQY